MAPTLHRQILLLFSFSSLALSKPLLRENSLSRSFSIEPTSARPSFLPSDAHRIHRRNHLHTRGGAGASRILAQLVGLGVTFGSCTLKVPQIAKCVSANSVVGVSLYSTYFELNSYLGSAIYHYLQGYPLSTWAENLSLTAQQVVLIALMWKLSKHPPAIGHISLFLALEAVFIGGSFYLPKRARPLLIVSNGVLNLFSSVAQIWLTFASKSVGQLSWTTLALSLAGNIARLFTTLVLAKGDGFLLLTCAVAAALNSIRVIQFFVYS